MRYLALIFSFLIISAYSNLSKASEITYTDVPIELKGIILKSSLDTAKLQFPNAECVPQKERIINCTVKNTTFADSKATLYMTFIDGSLHAYTFSNIPITKYQLVVDSLTSKYGKPMRDYKAYNGLVRELGTGNYFKGIYFWRSSNLDSLQFQFDYSNKFPSVFDLLVTTAQYWNLKDSISTQTESNKKVSSDI